MTNALRWRGEMMYNLLSVLVFGASLAIVGSPTFAFRREREFMMTRSLIHATSAILASAVLALSFAAAPARAATITINGSNCTWDSGSQALTCSSNGGGASAPSGCTLNPSQSTVSAGATVSLTASCNGGGAPTSYAWSGGGLPSTGGSSVSTTVAATSIYSVTPSNATGSGNTATTTVTVGSAPPPPPPSGGLANCTAQGLTVVSGNAIPTTWGTGGVWYSSQAGAFGDNAVWVFTITVPAGTPPSSANGFFTLSEYGSQPTPRQLTISTQACDFRGWDFSGAAGPLATCNNGTSCRVLFAVQTPTIQNLFSGIAGLTAGTTYYISARNWSSSGSSCGGSNCTAVMNASAPQ
jgi:hypothetical protein